MKNLKQTEDTYRDIRHKRPLAVSLNNDHHHGKARIHWQRIVKHRENAAHKHYKQRKRTCYAAKRDLKSLILHHIPLSAAWYKVAAHHLTAAVGDTKGGAGI